MAKKKKSAILKGENKKVEDKIVKMPEKSSNIALTFYSDDRWNNWIIQVKESGFEIKDEEEEDIGNAGEIFVNMEDDVILACLKVISKYNNNELSNEEAFNAISEIKEVVLKPVDPINESIDLMLDSLQTSLISVFASGECYIDGGYESTDDFPSLIKSAVSAEEANDPGTAISYVAVVGAHVLNGAELGEGLFNDLPYGLVAEWMDGIDSISAAMMGDDSYKHDEDDSE